MDKHEGFVFRIANTKEGDTLLKNLKNTFNKDSYKLKVRFSGKRHTKFSGHTRKEDATSYRVYITKKWNDPTTPFDYIQRGREIEKGQQVLKNARADVSVTDELSYMETFKYPHPIHSLSESNNDFTKSEINSQVALLKVQEKNQLLETKLALLNEGLKNSVKYRHYIDTINGLTNVALLRITKRT